MCTFGVFGYVYVMMQLCMIVLCCMYLYMNVWCIHPYVYMSGSDSYSGLEGDQTVGEVFIIMQWE